MRCTLLTVTLGLLLGAAATALAAPSPDNTPTTAAELAALPSPANAVHVPFSQLASKSKSKNPALLLSPDSSARNTTIELSLMASDFLYSCWDVGVWNSFTLYGCCANGAGHPQRTSIWLGHCLANRNGNLVGEFRGAHDNTCRACEWHNDRGAYSCYCDYSGGANRYTEIGLNSLVSNQWGTMECYGIYGGEEGRC